MSRPPVPPAEVFTFTLTVWHDPAETAERQWGAHVYLMSADRPTPQGGRRLHAGHGVSPAAAVAKATENAFRLGDVDV